MQGDTRKTSSSNGPYKNRPGDRIYRVPRMITRHIVLPKFRPPKRLIGVSLLSFVYGFAAMIAVGTILLMMPD
jgi:hypothetical protein